MTRAPEVSIVIVTHNSRPDVDRCLKSISNHPPRRSFEVLIFDNASTDATVSAVRECFPPAVVIGSDVNLGYGAAVNCALRRAAGRGVRLAEPGYDRASARRSRSADRNGWLAAKSALSGRGSDDPTGVLNRLLAASLFSLPLALRAYAFAEWLVALNDMASAYIQDRSHKGDAYQRARSRTSIQWRLAVGSAEPVRRSDPAGSPSPAGHRSAHRTT